MDSVPLMQTELLTEHTFFQAEVLDVEALEIVSKSAPQQTWHCKATHERVTMIHENERYDWAF